MSAAGTVQTPRTRGTSIKRAARTAVRVGLIAALAAASTPSWSQLPPASSRNCALEHAGRPSIGLVLSGGGARGGAHIGVLEALEDLRVPIDCIAGTSVGAVIGGFYASGLSVSQIDEIARGIDLSTAFLAATPRAERTFRRKRDDFLFLVNVRPGLRSGGFALPIGLVQGQAIDMTLSRALVDSYAVRDFDRLATPFRAVATDVATGRPVVLGSGDLALSLRASMSLPAVLMPIDIDGHMLVDGGLAMNLPVEVVQSMGADVVIAVDASSALLGRESMRSVLDITSQLTTLMTLPSIEQQKELLDEDDVLLTPSFGTRITFTNFALLGETIADGYRAVMDRRDRFEQWSLDEASYAAYVAARGPARPAPPIVDFVRLDNRSSIADSIIAARIGEIARGAPLDVSAVEAAVGRVYGLELFQSVRYEVVEDGGGTGLEIRVEERAWGPSYFEAGLHYASSSKSDALFVLAASYLRTGINPHGGEWRATLSIGDEPGAAADFYQPLGSKGSFFVESRLGYQSTVFNVFAGDHVVTSFDIRDTELELAAGRVFGGAAEIRGGVGAASGDYGLEIGDPERLPGDDFRSGDVFVRLSVDTLDNVAFPRAGTASFVEWRSSHAGQLSADDDFDQLLLHAAAAKTWKRHTLFATLRYDATTQGRAPVHSQFRLGGFRDLSGLTRNELAGQNAAGVGLSYYRQVGSFSLFPAFAGISLERANVWGDRHAIAFDDTIAAASLWAGMTTPIGPVYLGAGRTDDGRSAVYLSLGGAF